MTTPGSNYRLEARAVLSALAAGPETPNEISRWIAERFPAVLRPASVHVELVELSKADYVTPILGGPVDDYDACWQLTAAGDALVAGGLNSDENATRNEEEPVTDQPSPNGKAGSGSPSSRVKSQNVKGRGKTSEQAHAELQAALDGLRAAACRSMTESTIRKGIANVAAAVRREPKTAAAVQQMVDKAIYGNAYEGPDGERIDPRRVAPDETVTGAEPTEVHEDEVACSTCGALTGEPCTEGGVALGPGIEHITRVRRRMALKPEILRTDDQATGDRVPTCGGMTARQVADRVIDGDELVLLTPGRVPVEFLQALAERLKFNLTHSGLKGDVRERTQRIAGHLERMLSSRGTGHHLVPSIGLDRVAAVMLAGEPEHGDRWKTRTPKHHIAAAYRHLAKWCWGQSYDRDLYAQGHGKHSHLACAAARILMALHLIPEPEDGR